MQRKLTEGEIEKLKQARSNINDVLVPTYDDQGRYWSEVLLSLGDKIKHGTSDGKPYVEPEPPIPEGYRKANGDEYKRKDVQCWYVYSKKWRPRMDQGTEFDPPQFSTRYIVPIDPPLADEDARERPWVMCRNHTGGFWVGPSRLLAGPPTALSWVVVTSGGSILYFDTVRRATHEEIEAAK